MNQEFSDMFRTYILSGQSMFYVNSVEEARVVEMTRKVGWSLMLPTVLTGEVAQQEVEDVLSFCKHSEAASFAKTKRIDARLLLDLYDHLNHRVPRSDDEEAVVAEHLELVQRLLDHHGYPTVTWDQVAGFEKTGVCQEDFAACLRIIGDRASTVVPRRCIIVVKDAHAYLNEPSNPLWRRALRNAYEDNMLVSADMSRHVLFLQPHLQPHGDIRHCLARLPFRKPDDREIALEIATSQAGIVSADKRECPADLKQELVSALRGLTTTEIANALNYCLVEFKGFVRERTVVDEDGTTRTRNLVGTIRKMRSDKLNAGKGMRIIDPDDDEITMLGDLGGYDNIRSLANRVRFCRYDSMAIQAKLKAPSGFAIAGPSGTGKTIAGKLFARWLGVPLVIIQMGTTKEGVVGGSEQNMAATLETIEALGDPVVLFDEWDKQAGGIIGSNSDGNTSSGMLSLILDFASDPRRRAFLIFTMNRLTGPIESLRTGRISHFFYTPLPNAEERRDIVNLKLRERDATTHDTIDRFVMSERCDTLSGAELDGMVNEAVILAVEKSGYKKPTVEDFQEARDVITPISQLGADQMQAMEMFEKFAVSVNKPRKGKAAAKRKVTT